MHWRAGFNLGAASLNSYLVSWERDGPDGKFSRLPLLSPWRLWGCARETDAIPAISLGGFRYSSDRAYEF